uniref:Phosphatidylcholine transfer protein n=1 Tax=Bos mutus grunniens TaxID=30521 RepID=A0A8B9Y9X9_BOSMU
MPWVSSSSSQAAPASAGRWSSVQASLNCSSEKVPVPGSILLQRLPRGPEGRMEPGTGTFSEEQFREACAELQRPALSGAAWELLMETQGISVYGLLDQQTGLYAYKVFGVLEDCLPDLLADVYMDLAYRKQWDQYVKELYEKECSGETVVYWQVKYPFPMSNRDYVYVRQRQELDFEGQKVHVILAQSTSEPQFPEKSGVIRVKHYKQRLAIQSDGKKGSKVFMYYFDNPGGQIPSWVINWAAKNGVPNFLKDMVKACQNYKKT